MELEVLLSVMNLNIKDLDKMNISSKCVVINQCDKKEHKKYKNFDIYSYKEVGLSNSRNRGLEHIKSDIILLCDDDVVYNDNYETQILNEFKRLKDADIIIFNLDSPNRKIKDNKTSKRLHFYNTLRYSSQRIAIRKTNDIKFNTLFGAGAKYSNGEEALYLVEALKKKLKIYSSTVNIGTVYHEKSSWFKGYDEKFFFDKGAIFTAISKRFRHLLMLQYLIRHKEVLSNLGFNKAYKNMLKGSKDYMNTIRSNHE